MHPQWTVIGGTTDTSAQAIAPASETAGASSVATKEALIAIAYAVVGTSLVLSRLAGLGHGFWLDEAVFVEDYVREGPHQILLGPSLSHELYALLSWLTASLIKSPRSRSGSCQPFLSSSASRS